LNRCVTMLTPAACAASIWSALAFDTQLELIRGN